MGYAAGTENAALKPRHRMGTGPHRDVSCCHASPARWVWWHRGPSTHGHRSGGCFPKPRFSQPYQEAEGWVWHREMVQMGFKTPFLRCLLPWRWIWESPRGDAGGTRNMPLLRGKAAHSVDKNNDQESRIWFPGENLETITSAPNYLSSSLPPKSAGAPARGQWERVGWD